MSVFSEGQRLGVPIVRPFGEGGDGGSIRGAAGTAGPAGGAQDPLHADHAKNQEPSRGFQQQKVPSRLEHPSIVQVSDSGMQPMDGVPVMEYLRGQSLASRLDTLSERDSDRQSRRRSRYVCRCQTCFRWHTRRGLHRDIKPANLMLVADPVAPGESGSRCSTSESQSFPTIAVE